MDSEVMTLNNIFPTIEQARNVYDAIDYKEAPWSHCISRYSNEKYCVTFAIWCNEYGRCTEVGLRNLETNKFRLVRQSGFRSCLTHFNRIARLINANRDLKI